jgi:diguanylate cyclase (GGDEF)-like protein
MSFRARLTLFFVLIVIVPMLSVAIVLFRLISDNETGKSDSSLAARQQVADNLYRDAVDRNERAIEAVGADRVLAESLRTGDLERARRRARQMELGRGIDRIALVKGGRSLIDVGDRTAVAPARRDLIDRARRGYGRLEVSTTTAKEYAARIRRLTTARVILRQGSRTLAATVPRPIPALPRPAHPADVQVGDRKLRAVTFAKDGFGPRQVLVGVLEPNASRSDNIRRAYLIAAGILLGFLILAITFALAVSRSLQAQIGEFLGAARRLAGGDFSTDVPTTGADEFAALGEEFNKMSQQLATRLEELRSERARLASTLRNIGEAFASNLDRDALLEIVVRTAVDGVEAQGGRASARMDHGEELEERARAGDLTGVEEALRTAEQDVLSGGAGQLTIGDDLHAIAQPLHGANGTGQALGLVSVARRGRPFDDGEREVFGYLAAQAAVSIENVGLHERVQRQAVTDALTGLYNHRRFREAIESEAERARRFGQEMGLVMLDIDNFKQVNDSYGHQQGDRVLAEVARVVKERTREIDSPARYGGEELAVVLPQTDLEGAFNLAERIRIGIEELELPLPDGTGRLRVTASLGVASLPTLARDSRELLAKADAALYRAKREGKNRTFRAV